jgi:N-acetylated-alpha-linked acidic dipeptidase
LIREIREIRGGRNGSSLQCRGMGRLILAALLLQSQSPALPSVSVAEMQQTLNAINHDRTSGKAGERKAAAYLESRLKEYGVAYVRHEVRAFLSWPVRGSVAVDGSAAAIDGLAPAFGGSTPREGIVAEPLWLNADADDRDPGALPSAARGRIVVANGMISPDSARRAELAGAVGLVHVNDDEILHEMIATTIWGTPSTSSAERLPTIPIVSITKSAGERLRQSAVGKRLRLVADVQRGWTEIPLVVAEVPGQTPDFILVATHLDAWYEGMTDTAGTVASILEMARVLGQGPKPRRGVRFAWWPGHSFGRYAGSTWYADRFWRELDEHAVAYTNLDGAGRRGSRVDAVAAGGWPGLAEFSRVFAASRLGRVPTPAATRLFRPGRDSDSAFQGIGIPEFFVGVPGPERGHPDVTAAGRIAYWHTKQDTIDKLDMKVLELDTKYRLAQIVELATLPTLPHRLAPIAVSYERALDELITASAGRFDLGGTKTLASKLRALAETFDQSASETEAARADRDRILIRLTHRLNSTLYTQAGRFDQDPAATIPILPLLAGVRELGSMDRSSDAYGFLETELMRGRNAVEATLSDAIETLTAVKGKTS